MAEVAQFLKESGVAASAKQRPVTDRCPSNKCRILHQCLAVEPRHSITKALCHHLKFTSSPASPNPKLRVDDRGVPVSTNFGKSCAFYSGAEALEGRGESSITNGTAKNDASGDAEPREVPSFATAPVGVDGVPRSSGQTSEARGRGCPSWRRRSSAHTHALAHTVSPKEVLPLPCSRACSLSVSTRQL